MMVDDICETVQDDFNMDKQTHGINRVFNMIHDNNLNHDKHENDNSTSDDVSIISSISTSKLKSVDKICDMCDENESPIEDDKWIFCTCHREWFHCFCLEMENLTAEELQKKQIGWVCKACRADMTPSEEKSTTEDDGSSTVSCNLSSHSPEYQGEETEDSDSDFVM